jgi:response regulator RpfG family c-di-GMP phosphodiesterase
MRATAAQTELPHILLVDDDRLVLAGLSRMLGQLKVNLHLADGPASALKVLRSTPIDVVISDYRMPRTDGGSFLKQVQAEWPGTMRILLTAYADQPEIKEAVQQAAVHRVLTKPCEPEELCGAITEALSWRTWTPAPTPPPSRAVDHVDDRLFRQLFHTAMDPMMLADLDGTIIEVNCAFVRRMGGSCRAALEHRPTIATGWQMIWPAVQPVLLAEGQWSGEVHHATEDRFAAINITVLADAEGAPCGLAAVERDITVHRKIEAESRLAQYSVPLALAKLAEFREPEVGTHLERMRAYCWLLALELGRSPALASVVDSVFVEEIYAASPLHDVGKVGIPDSVLLKPGALTDVEWQVMRTHSAIGAEILAHAGSGSLTPRWLAMGRLIALQHHEKWDGSGYPAHLRGEEIDLAARIVALADAYDAITSKRVYKDAVGHEEAYRRIVESSGSHFDPAVVGAFTRVAGSFQETMARELQARPAPEPVPAGGRSASGMLRRINSVLLSMRD